MIDPQLYSTHKCIGTKIGAVYFELNNKRLNVHVYFKIDNIIFLRYWQIILLNHGLIGKIMQKSSSAFLSNLESEIISNLISNKKCLETEVKFLHCLDDLAVQLYRQFGALKCLPVQTQLQIFRAVFDTLTK